MRSVLCLLLPLVTGCTQLQIREGTKGAVDATLTGCNAGYKVGDLFGGIIGGVFLLAGCTGGLAASPIAFVVKANECTGSMKEGP